MTSRLPLLALAVAIAFAACAPGSDPARSTGSARLVVYGAASLRAVLDDLRDAYADVRPDVRIEVSTDASSALATQILEGAPADLFLSADTVHPQRIADAGLAVGSPVTIARTELVVITPPDDPGGIGSTADLGRDGVRIVAAGSAVPITRYAEPLIAGLAELPDHPADLAARYERNIVSREANVQAIVAKIALGEGDAGIVYRTDALAAGRIRTVEIPDEAQVTAEYAGIVLAGSPRREVARAFLDWVRGPEGQAILVAAGFRGEP